MNDFKLPKLLTVVRFSVKKINIVDCKSVTTIENKRTAYIFVTA